MPGFMHVARAVGSVCNSQMERLLVGLQDVSEPIDGTSWGSYRAHLDDYLRFMEELGDVLSQEYAPQLARTRGKGAVLIDVVPVRDAILETLQVRQRLLAVMSRLRVSLPGRADVAAQVWPRNLTHEQNWANYARLIEAHGCRRRRESASF